MTATKLTGAAIRSIRRSLGLTQAAFASRLHLHPNSLARMERNEVHPRASTVELIRRIEAEGRPVPVAGANRGIRIRGDD